MTLYELTSAYRNLVEAIEAGEIPEEAINDTLEAVGGEFELKCDNVACAIKNLLAEAEMIKAEEEKLAERRKRKLASADRLSEYLSASMQRAERMKLETPRNSITHRRSLAIRITDEEAFLCWADKNAPEAVKTTVKRAPVLSCVRELVKTVNVPYAVVEERQNIQIK